MRLRVRKLCGRAVQIAGKTDLRIAAAQASVCAVSAARTACGERVYRGVAERVPFEKSLYNARRAAPPDGMTDKDRFVCPERPPFLPYDPRFRHPAGNCPPTETWNRAGWDFLAER